MSRKRIVFVNLLYAHAQDMVEIFITLMLKTPTFYPVIYGISITPGIRNNVVQSALGDENELSRTKKKIPFRSYYMCRYTDDRWSTIISHSWHDKQYLLERFNYFFFKINWNSKNINCSWTTCEQRFKRIVIIFSNSYSILRNWLYF